MTKAGTRLIKAAKEARDIALGAKSAKLHIPADIDVKSIRTHLQMTQDDFAAEFGFSISQIRDWEQKRFRPSQSDRAYLTLIIRNPDRMRDMLQAVKIESSDPCVPEKDELAV